MSLSVYEARAKKMTAAVLHFALKDVRETLAIWDRDPNANPSYLEKLYAEFDAYVCETVRRQRAA